MNNIGFFVLPGLFIFLSCGPDCGTACEVLLHCGMASSFDACEENCEAKMEAGFVSEEEIACVTESSCDEIPSQCWNE